MEAQCSNCASSGKCTGACGGFRLIELLVVVAIMAIPAGAIFGGANIAYADGHVKV